MSLPVFPISRMNKTALVLRLVWLLLTSQNKAVVC
jgi:hypothetical protein